MTWAEKFNKANKQSSPANQTPANQSGKLSDEGAFTRGVDSAAPGLLKTPVLGDIVKSLLSGSEMVAQAGKTGLDTVTGQNVPETDFISPSTAQKLGASGQKDAPFGQAMAEGVGTGLGAGLAADTVVGGPGLIKGGVGKSLRAASNLKEAIPSLVSGAKGWENIIDSVSGAKSIDPAAVTGRALGEAKGEVSAVQNEIKRILTEEFPQKATKAQATPGKGAGTSYIKSGINPILAAEKASSFGQKAGQKFFESGVGSDTQKAYAIIAKAIKTELGEVAPKYQGANKLYGQGATLRKVAPTIAKSIGAKAGLPAAGVGVGGFLYELVKNQGQSGQ